MSTEESISNPFARVLQFYYLYQRTKLVASDLEKIARKYGNKQDKLLTDLQQKYPFEIPSSVSKHQLSMLCSMHSIPPSYANCMKVRDISYDSRCDVYRANFDPLHCLLWNDISVSHINAPALDNISKTLCILPNCEVPVVAPVRKDADFPSNSSLSTMVTEKSTVDAAPKTKHLFETIAEVAVRGKIPRNSHNHEVQTASPMALLQQCMQQRVRVRIIIRRNHSVRGSLDAYVLAFDKHFNMLLSDVDEEYITNNQKRRAMAMGRFCSQNNVMQRHLPQLILRGDQVVMVFKKPLHY